MVWLIYFQSQFCDNVFRCILLHLFLWETGIPCFLIKKYFLVPRKTCIFILGWLLYLNLLNVLWSLYCFHFISYNYFSQLFLTLFSLTLFSSFKTNRTMYKLKVYNTVDTFTYYKVITTTALANSSMSHS